jgi:hypothetical protein
VRVYLVSAFMVFSCKSSNTQKDPEHHNLNVYNMVQPANSLLCYTKPNKNTEHMVVVSQKTVKDRLKKEGVSTLVGNSSTSWGYGWGPAYPSYYIRSSKKAKEKLLKVLGFKKDVKLEWSGEDGVQLESSAFYVRPALKEHLHDICNEKIKEKYPESDFVLYEMRSRKSKLQGSGYPIVTIVERPQGNRYLVKRLYRLGNPNDKIELKYKKIIEVAKIALDPYLLEDPAHPYYKYKLIENEDFKRIDESKGKFYASSFYKESSNTLYVSYKGSSNVDDIKADVVLMTGTFIHKIMFGTKRLFGKKSTLEIYLEKAKDFFKQSKQKIIDNGVEPASTRVIFTGHSLGGFIAAITSYELLREQSDFEEMLAVVFSSPAPFRADNIKDLITPKKRTNVYNFFRDKDVVTRLSGRHPESTFVFNAAEDFEKFGSHFLGEFIKMLIDLDIGSSEDFLKDVKLSCQAKVVPDFFTLKPGYKFSDICF